MIKKKKHHDVSSPNLFHFTRSIEGLKGILSDRRFNVSNCKERYPFILPNLIRDVPAVCFCDLPQGARMKHKQKYGYYAISFKKNWADKYEICPIIYCRQRGKVSRFLRAIYNNPSIPDDVKNGILDFCKPTKGYEFLKMEKDWSKNMIVFANEREWRYTPKTSSDKQYLPFELSDILYVYVEKLSDRDQLTGLIDMAKIKVSSKH